MATSTEPILLTRRREIRMLVARGDVTITQSQYAGGEQVAAPHVHHAHTDAFYILEGELTFEIGRGLRDGTTVEWDIASVPADGGLPAGTTIVSRRG